MGTGATTAQPMRMGAAQAQPMGMGAAPAQPMGIRRHWGSAKALHQCHTCFFVEKVIKVYLHFLHLPQGV